MYRRYLGKLEALYKGRAPKDIGSHGLWGLRDWVSLMEHCAVFEDSSFTREEAHLCFYYAKFTVVDPVKHAQR